ncbi:hypothetical protein G7083_07385 [Vibrio sp. HDW18]|uniref:hypothetical protein n=1 Tax=Vibrio sp. HDW18 TaxID=2714948 RepID=UPI00140DD1EA|nr:hypothetical protein [Vibrio sp. HDW18]QIL85693.1 hypothetical protein G7083_07385 [Vibrio sp. HDW18]
MKKQLLILSVISPSPALAQITDSSQLYFGSKQPTQSCGVQGRLATVAEIEALKLNANLCSHVASPWAIWKVQDEDGTLWSFMGYNYACETKAGSNEWNESVCVMDEALANTAQMFPQANYHGAYPWDGRAAISTVGDEVSNTNIQSFKLGSDVQLTAFSDTNYTGQTETFTESATTTPFEIKSYKLKFIDSPYEYSFSFQSSKDYKTCLKLQTSSGITTEICSDSTNSELSLGNTPTQGQITIAAYLNSYENSTPTPSIGQIVLSVNDENQTLSIQHESLPEGLQLNLDDRNMAFIYN